MDSGLTTFALFGSPVLGAVLWTIGTVLLWTLAVVVGVLLVVLLGVLLFPFHVRADGAVHGTELSGRATVRWAWGVLAVRLAPGTGATVHLMGIRIWTVKGSDEPKKPKKPKKPQKKRRELGRLRWSLEYRQHALRLLQRLLGALRLRLRITGELGLDDPADTAALAAFLNQLERSQERVELRVRPDWMDETIELDGDFRARVWLIHIGLILLGALLRKDTRRMLRAAR